MTERGPDDEELDDADDNGLSLDELGKAYAQLMGAGEDPYVPPAAGQAGGGEPSAPPWSDDSPPPADAACDLSPRSILEAMLFVGHPQNLPLSARQVAALMRGVSPREIDELVVELNGLYDELGTPYRIESEGAGYLLRLRSEYHGVRDRFHGKVRAAKLSQPAIDALAIVAYRPGLTRDEVDAIRGAPTGALLNQLVRRRLVRIERPDTKPRRPRYHTTDRFLELFGLESLADLPQSDED